MAANHPFSVGSTAKFNDFFA